VLPRHPANITEVIERSEVRGQIAEVKALAIDDVVETESLPLTSDL
jgi:hypothetical protein